MWFRSRTQRPTHRDRVLAWQQCAVCSYDFATGEGERACHWYACPYLPEELDVFCPTCNYDFFTGEGQPGCGQTPRCDFARLEAPQRVRLLREWRALHLGDAGTETTGSAVDGGGVA